MRKRKQTLKKSKPGSELEKRLRAELLERLGVQEFFADGSISINTRTCKGVECQLCIKACPTNALFWKTGEVGITRELCIYCGACVLNCIVNDCIRIVRKRALGDVESFSDARDYVALQHRINGKKRSKKIKEVFPKTEDYFKWRKQKQVFRK